MPTIITKSGSLEPFSNNDIIAIIDAKKLHSTIVNKTANELQYLSEDCYYPRIADIYKELLALTQCNEADLAKYSKIRFKNPNWKILHDPKLTLLVLITQEFLKNNDTAAAIATVNLISLMFYSKLMHRYFKKYCNDNYFRAAYDRLSHNHLFRSKDTIGSSILYLASQIFKKYKPYLEKDDTDKIIAMIYEFRGRINQSLRSFAAKYYDIAESGGAIRLTREDLPEQKNLEKKFRQAADDFSKEICIYGTKDKQAEIDAQQISKFNRSLSKEYVEALSDIKHRELISLTAFLFLSTIQKTSNSTKLDYINETRKLMAVKASNKPVYFKKVLTQLHNTIVQEIGRWEYFDNLSVQSKGISRTFLAHYITISLYNFLHN